MSRVLMTDEQKLYFADVANSCSTLREVAKKLGRRDITNIIRILDRLRDGGLRIKSFRCGCQPMPIEKKRRLAKIINGSRDVDDATAKLGFKNRLHTIQLGVRLRRAGLDVKLFHPLGRPDRIALGLRCAVKIRALRCLGWNDREISEATDVDRRALPYVAPYTDAREQARQLLREAA